MTGLLVPPRDASGLAAAVLQLLADPERCRQMGLRARTLAESEFGIETVSASTLAVYRNVLGR